MFIDFPDGERREADVVAKLETFDRSPELVLIHVEVQLRPEPWMPTPCRCGCRLGVTTTFGRLATDPTGTML